MADEIKKEAPATFKVTIDNITINVAPGTTILNAARQIGGDVTPPAMCYYSKLEGSVTSPPIWRVAFNIVVPGATLIVMLSMVTLNVAGASFFISSAIIISCQIYIMQPLVYESDLHNVPVRSYLSNTQPGFSHATQTHL